jgi:hypothetical protein
MREWREQAIWNAQCDIWFNKRALEHANSNVKQPLSGVVSQAEGVFECLEVPRQGCGEDLWPNENENFRKSRLGYQEAFPESWAQVPKVAWPLLMRIFLASYK